MSIRRTFGTFVCMSLLFAARFSEAEVAVPVLFSDHMVLQQGMPVPVWGTAQPGEQVTVTLGDHKASVQADEKGRWRVRLDAMPAGGPTVMTVAGSNTITINDVLIGEVWVCSGQSNMHFPVNRVQNAEQEIAAADHPRIRLFMVPRRPADEPLTEAQGEWKVCSPETVQSFSAVGYFFGRDLHEHLKVPVGLIQSSLGGTPAEAWTPRPALEADPDYQPMFERWQQMIAAHDRQLEKEGQKGPAATMAASKPTKRAAANRPATRMAASKPTSRPRPTSQASRPSDDPRQSPHRPSVLFNGMIHPLIPYAIRGAIWYQGEGNAIRAYQYRKLFATMIRAWRERWGQGNFPFLFVQLANYQARQKEPYVSDWAELREAQLMALAPPKTGMAVTIDIGNPKDVHPTNKQEVGKRLALAARAIAYGEKIPYSGPIYESMTVEGGRVRLRFRHTDGGLAAEGGEPLKGFGIAGQDRKFVDAEAVIDGDTVVVSSDKVGEPVAVRYAWADVPECNLFNGAGLPASPFRTDDWPGITADAK